MAPTAKTSGSIDSGQLAADIEKQDRLLHSTREPEIRLRAYEIYLARFTVWRLSGRFASGRT
jgi:hypothetical protein